MSDGWKPTVQLGAPVDPGLRQLQIGLGDAIEPPSPDHKLLVGFHFGAPHPHAQLPGAVSVELAPLGHERSFESWWYRGEVRVTGDGAISVAECDDYAVVILKAGESDGDDFQAVTRQAYEALVAAVRRTPHSQIIKVWNYVGGINSGAGDLERYRQFSVGRAAAFAALGVEDQVAPTGTAIGTLCDTGLTLIALASKRCFQLTENPRQVSAFRYPRKYGPSSPKFSRGGYVATKSHRLFVLSGTAAVVGHESAWPYDVLRQTDETLRNLDVLCSSVSALDVRATRLVLDRDSVLRAYLRDPDDYERVAQKLDRAFGPCAPSVIFLHGFICRRELMVEIDGARVTGN